MFEMIGQTAEGVKHFVVNNKSEITEIYAQTHCSMGSTAYVINEQKTYIYNGLGEWKLKPNSTSGGGSGDNDIIVNVNGGNI